MSAARASGAIVEVRGAHLLVDQAADVAVAVGVAGDRDGGLGALAHGAQRGAALEVAGLDHDAAIAQRRAENAFDRRHDVAAAGAHADRAAAAEQRHGRGFVDQARRIGRERVAVEPHQRERIGGIVDRGADDRVDALADQAGVGTEHQHDRARRDRDARRRIRCRRISARPCSLDPSPEGSVAASAASRRVGQPI